MDPSTMLSAGGSVLDYGAGLFQGEADRRKLERARRDMLAGIDNAQNSYTGAYDKSMGMYQPHVDRGGLADDEIDRLNASYNPNDYKMNDFGEYTYDKDVQDFLDPSMDYQQDRMRDATQASAVASGGLLSGATLKALNKNASDLAQTDWGNASNRMNTDRQFNYGNYVDKFKADQSNIMDKYNKFQDQIGRQQGISDRGYNATGNQANLTQTQGSNMAGLDMNRGNVNANYQMNQGSFWEDAIGGLGGLAKGAGNLLGGMSFDTPDGTGVMGMGDYAQNATSQWQNQQSNPYNLQSPNSNTFLAGLGGYNEMTKAPYTNQYQKYNF